MTNALIQMTLLMLCGAFWGYFTPNSLTAAQTRLVLTSAVFYFFLPMMVLDVLWKANIGWQSAQLSALGFGSISLGIVGCWLFAKLLRFNKPQTGALLLAAGFPNVTYLGLPVLEQTFGSIARSVIIQIDLFSVAPMVYTVGIMLAQHYGATQKPDKRRAVWHSFNTPPFWAVFLAVLLNINQVAIPVWLQGLMTTCSAAVAPLMIFSLGMALSWRSVHIKNLPLILPVIVMKLLLNPWAASYASTFMGMDSQIRSVAIMDIAMPSMVLGIVLCDKYKLDSALYAATVTVTTALSLFSLPFWHGLLV